MNWSRFAAIRTFVLVLAGLALISIAAFLSPLPWLGYGVAGMSALLLAYLTDPGGAQQR